jgi:hypothetical protein
MPTTLILASSNKRVCDKRWNVHIKILTVALVAIENSKTIKEQQYD